MDCNVNDLFNLSDTHSFILEKSLNSNQIILLLLFVQNESGVIKISNTLIAYSFIFNSQYPSVKVFNVVLSDNLIFLSIKFSSNNLFDIAFHLVFWVNISSFVKKNNSFNDSFENTS